jgi:FMN phosphatase YigB (HAD superfamily)
MFDLDGTLLHFSQDDFIKVYFAELGKLFVRLGMDAEMSVKAIWVGTKSMIEGDGSCTNAERFWAAFAEYTKLSGDKLNAVKAACDEFYLNEFNNAKSVIIPNDISKRLVRTLAAKGYQIVLATNPLFPACAVATRLGWIGLEMQDFVHVTHYSNSTFCKPNPDYYREIFKKIDRLPEQCFFAGNNTIEDMSAGDLGVETFLVTDCLENEPNIDIAVFKNGTLKELEEYLTAMPSI